MARGLHVVAPIERRYDANVLRRAGATIVAPYSPRASEEATVSFPVTPEELASVSPEDFTIGSVPDLLDRPEPRRWSALAGERSRLPKALLHE